MMLPLPLRFSSHLWLDSSFVLMHTVGYDGTNEDISTVRLTDGIKFLAPNFGPEPILSTVSTRGSETTENISLALLISLSRSLYLSN